ncbi:phage protein Gp27 family protein [Sphingomonas sp. CJ99]
MALRTPRRHRPSTIDRKDGEVRELIAQLRIDHGWTIDEIHAKLKEIGQSDISRSALARHTKSLDEIGQELRASREMAKQLMGQLGEGDEDRMLELNVELMQSMLVKMQTSIGEDGQPVTFNPMEAMLLSKTIQQLAGARKTNADFILRLRAETARAAAKAVDEVAKTRPAGLTRETVDEIKRQIMGIAV